MDDLSFLEINNLLSVSIASYNVRAHVPSDVLVNNQVIPAKNLKTQDQLRVINDWTKKKKMRLNIKRTKIMIFNFSKNHQFTSRFVINDGKIELVKETKLLGTVITDKWLKNTKEIVKKGFQRMQLLKCPKAVNCGLAQQFNIKK